MIEKSSCHHLLYWWSLSRITRDAASETRTHDSTGKHTDALIRSATATPFLKLIISNRNLYLTLYITWVGPLKCTIIKQWQKKEELMFVILRVLFCSQYYRWRGSISHFSTVVETYTILNQDFSNQNKKMYELYIFAWRLQSSLCFNIKNWLWYKTFIFVEIILSETTVTTTAREAAWCVACFGVLQSLCGKA